MRDAPRNSDQRTKEIELEEVRSTFSKWSIGGIAVINFQQKLGPYLQTYASDGKTEFIRQFRDDPTLPAEFAVIGKHVKKCFTRKGDRVLIQPYGKGRAKYVLIELRGEENRKAKKFLTFLKENLEEGTKSEVMEIVKEGVEQLKAC